MPSLPPHRFATVTLVSLVAATALLGLGSERLARGATTLGSVLLVVGVLAAVLALTIRLEGDPRRTTLMLVSRKDCPACDEAARLLRNMAADTGFAVWMVDADSSSELRAAYGDEVPVLVRDGESVATFSVTEEDVRRALRTKTS